MSNNQEFQEKLTRILNSIDGAVEKAVAQATATLSTLADNRIFDQGLDAKGQKIGTYSEAYKKVRKKRGGLQNNFVDLTFTTSLGKSIGKNSNRVLFTNEYGVRISQLNEKRYGKLIFAPTEKEKDYVINFINEEINKLWK